MFSIMNKIIVPQLRSNPTFAILAQGQALLITAMRRKR